MKVKIIMKIAREIEVEHDLDPEAYSTSEEFEEAVDDFDWEAAAEEIVKNNPGAFLRDCSAQDIDDYYAEEA